MFETTGQKLSKHLGIALNTKAVIQRAINSSSSTPVYRVVVDSKHPFRTILYSVIKGADSVKSGSYNKSFNTFKNFRFTPPKLLQDFNSNINDNSIIMFNDLSAEAYIGDKVYECKNARGEIRLSENNVRLNEFTIGDMKSGILDDFRKQFAKERQAIKGQEVRLTKLIKAQIIDGQHVRFHFLSEPTFEFHVPVVDPKTLSPNFKTDNTYDIFIQLQHFIPWLDKNELYFKNLTLKKFREVLKVVDVKNFCSCPSLQFGGINFELSKLDASLFPTNIPHTQWSKFYNKNGYGAFGLGCKHLGNLYRNISIFESVMLGKLREL